MKLIAALFGAAALLFPAAATPDTAPYAIAGGTWIVGWYGSLAGPAWWLDGPTAAYGVTLVGPGGFTKHMGGPNQRLSAMPSTRSTYWCNSTCGVQHPGGSWYAIGDGDHTKVTFTIDETSRLLPLQVKQYSGDANTFTATWSAEPNAQSFIAYVEDAGNDSAFRWIVGKILPGSTTSVTFDNMGLNPEWGYVFAVFAFSGDITGSSTPAVFNIASERVDFVPQVLASVGPQSGEPKLACYSLAGLTPCTSHAPPCYGCSRPTSVGPRDIVPYWHACGTTTAHGKWSLSAVMPTSCASAKTILRSYVGSSKCSKSCSVKSYRCSSSMSKGTKSVYCRNAARQIRFTSA